MTDKLLEEIEIDMIHGTQGPFDGGGRTIYAKSREGSSRNVRGAICMIMDNPEDGWMITHDSNRFTRVPEMEARIIADAEKIKALHSAQDYTYIGKDGKSVLARGLEDELDKVKRLAREMLERYDDVTLAHGEPKALVVAYQALKEATQ